MPTIGATSDLPPMEPKKGAQNEKTPPSAAAMRYPGSDAQFTPTPSPPVFPTCPELGSTINDDSSTASNALAGTCLSSSTRAMGQFGSAVPPKYQLEPLSARINP